MSTKALSHRDSSSRQHLWNFIWGLPYILGVVVVGHVLTQRYSIGMDDQKELCLAGHHRWYLIDHWNREFKDGDLMAFVSDERMRPFFKAETTFVKRVEGIPGERVQEDQDQIRVNERSRSHRGSKCRGARALSASTPDLLGHGRSSEVLRFKVLGGGLSTAGDREGVCVAVLIGIYRGLL